MRKSRRCLVNHGRGAGIARKKGRRVTSYQSELRCQKNVINDVTRNDCIRRDKKVSGDQLEPMHGLRASASRLGGYSHRERWRAPDRIKTRRKKLDSSLRPDISARAQTRGLLPSGALNAHPIKLFSHSRIMPGDLILCRVTLFSHRQLTNKSWARYSLSFV